eukprot:scaffold7112_cov82-Skeletonema_dohrnii-CCMP3373.AAC.4
MDGKPSVTSASPSDTALFGAEQNGVPSFEGSPVGDQSKGKGAPFSSASKSASSDQDQPGASPKKIHQWTGRANISFKYTKKKIDDLLTKAKKKMAEKLDCNKLECTQCNDSFPGESELRKHFHSEEHLAKVREKSESKTLGDLKAFARVRQFILSRISGPPAKQVTLKEQTQASWPPANEASLLAAANEIPVGTSLDGWFAGDFAPYESSTKYTFPPLGEETDIEAEEIRELKEKIGEMVVEFKKNEGELGYKFENNEYYRTMDVLEQQYSSVQELVTNLVMCSFKVNRKCGGYGERQSNGGGNEEEKASKKRKRTDEAKM